MKMEKLELIELIESKGYKLEKTPDYDWSLEDLKGDCFNAEVNSDIDPEKLKYEEKQFELRIEHEGVWNFNLINPNGESIESCCGFIGDGFFGSGVDGDFIAAIKDDIKNRIHEKAKDIVNREVYRCASELIQTLQENEVLIDEINEVAYHSEVVWTVYDADGKFIESFDNEHDADELLEENEGYYSEDTDEVTEALEFWIISDWLGDRLDERGQMTATIAGLRIWGRTTSGQAIYIDHVIESIVKDIFFSDSE